MICSMRQIFSRSLFIVLVIALALVVNARPSHFGENNQLVSEQEPSNNVVENGLKPWQMELLVQRLAEINNLQGGGEYGGGFDRSLRSGNEIKRQSRYRLCYFNPVSCFRK